MLARLGSDHIFHLRCSSSPPFSLVSFHMFASYAKGTPHCICDFSPTHRLIYPHTSNGRFPSFRRYGNLFRRYHPSTLFNPKFDPFSVPLPLSYVATDQSLRLLRVSSRRQRRRDGLYAFCHMLFYLLFFVFYASTAVYRHGVK